VVRGDATAVSYRRGRYEELSTRDNPANTMKGTALQCLQLFERKIYLSRIREPDARRLDERNSRSVPVATVLPLRLHRSRAHKTNGQTRRDGQQTRSHTVDPTRPSENISSKHHQCESAKRYSADQQRNAGNHRYSITAASAVAVAQPRHGGHNQRNGGDSDYTDS
jgi:hypothetical protein